MKDQDRKNRDPVDPVDPAPAPTPAPAPAPADPFGTTECDGSTEPRPSGGDGVPEEILGPGDIVDRERARAAFGLARTLEPRRPRSRRATALAREALTIFTALHARERDQVAAYLAREGAH